MQATMSTNDTSAEKCTDAPVAFQIRDRLKITDGQTAGSWILAGAYIDLQEVR